jgi:hypothetical protein
MHFVPVDNVYVYFRYDENQTVMVMINGNTEQKTLTMNRFSERMQGYGKALEITTGLEYTRIDEISIPGQTALIFELKR